MGVEGGSSLVAVLRLFTAVPPLAAEHRLQGTQASVVAARGVSSYSSWALERRLGSCGSWALAQAQELRFLGSRAQAQELWFLGSSAGSVVVVPGL